MGHNSWTRTEFSRLLGVDLDDFKSLFLLKKRLSDTDSTHLVLSTTWADSKIKRDSEFSFLHREGMFSVYRFRDGISKVITSPGVSVSRFTRLSPGHLLFEVKSDKGGFVYPAESYHPFWKLKGSVDAELSMLDTGMMKLKIPPGRHIIRLDYIQPKFPSLISWGTWIGMLLTFLLIKFGSIPCLRKIRTALKINSSPISS